MSELRTILLNGKFKAIQPLAHGGKRTGSIHTFRRETIFGEDGQPLHAIPSISGGTIRYSLRSVAAKIMHEFLVGGGTLPFPAVHAMHNGGALRETKSVTDVLTGEKQAKVRELLPLFAVFGGMGGARSISGRLDVDSALPITQETAFLAPHYDVQVDPQHLVSAYEIVQRLSFGRFGINQSAAVEPLITPDPEARAIPPGTMVWTQEVLPLGSECFHSICLNDATAVEASFFMEVYEVWARRARIGQQRRGGMGRIAPMYSTEVTSISGAQAETIPCDWREVLAPRKEEAIEALNWL